MRGPIVETSASEDRPADQPPIELPPNGPTP
jgi:hypothetical protein